jgi:hypothetical protein
LVTTVPPIHRATAHLIDAAGEPMIAARDEIPSFFTGRLSR